MNIYKDARKKLKLTQEKFAREMDVSLTTVRNWETRRNTPSVHDLVRISLVLNVPLGSLANHHSKEGE